MDKPSENKEDLPSKVRKLPSTTWKADTVVVNDNIMTVLFPAEEEEDE